MEAFSLHLDTDSLQWTQHTWPYCSPFWADVGLAPVQRSVRALTPVFPPVDTAHFTRTSITYTNYQHSHYLHVDALLILLRFQDLVLVESDTRLLLCINAYIAQPYLMSLKINFEKVGGKDNERFCLSFYQHTICFNFTQQFLLNNSEVMDLRIFCTFSL